MKLEGHQIIGQKRVPGTGAPQHGTNPANGESLEPPYPAASETQIHEAVVRASEAFPLYRKTSGAQRAQFLRAIADAIEAQSDHLAERAPLETGLPEGRIRMETGRTCNQLRLFASLVEEGSWVNARIDHGNPAREPLPKPDVRSMLQPLGPVVVFCASNFPLAFSVAGGDTASALAAGNPVLVKAHHSHPGTAEIVGRAVQEAAAGTGMPDGVFSLLYGSGRSVGSALVQHPLVRAVGFTGSQSGGRALMDLAAARPVPIPVYAEMGSLNPVFILPGALEERASQIAKGLSGSVNLGVGQFCTCPGLVIAPREDTLTGFADELSRLQNETAPAVMLNAGIADAYRKGVRALTEHAAVTTLARSETSDTDCLGAAALFTVPAKDFLGDAVLSAEVFGPSTTLVTHEKREELLKLAEELEGHLTATLHGTEEDLASHQDLIEILERKVGRLIFNGYPTGVEVCHAMVHGGPYPATSDGRSTSVGTQAIFRFTRCISYQDFPASQLPAELRDENPLDIFRLVDGAFQKGSA